MRWMMQRQQWFEMARITGIAAVMAWLTASMPPADARGAHGTNGEFAGHGAHGAEFTAAAAAATAMRATSRLRRTSAKSC
jgi:hypothetical protein